MSTTTGLRRGSSGCTDTDNNANDFTTFTVSSGYQPNNSSTATHSCAVVVPPVIGNIYPSSITTNAGNIVNFTVTNARVGQITDYDRLTLEVWTDGSVKPEDAVALKVRGASP